MTVDGRSTDSNVPASAAQFGTRCSSQSSHARASGFGVNSNGTASFRPLFYKEIVRTCGSRAVGAGVKLSIFRGAPAENWHLRLAGSYKCAITISFL